MKLCYTYQNAFSYKWGWIAMVLCISLIYSNIVQPIHSTFDAESTHIVDMIENAEEKSENGEDPIEEENEKKDKEKIRAHSLSFFFVSDYIILNIQSLRGSPPSPILDIIIPPPDLV